MKRRNKTTLLAGCLLAGGFLVPTLAQVSSSGPGPVVIISEQVPGQPGSIELVNVFAETQRPYFRDPQAPRFVLTDRQGRWALGIGGYIETVAEVDMGGTVDNVDFYPSDIHKGKPEEQLQMDMTTSTLFLKLVGKTENLGNIEVYTAGNWRGAGNTFQLLNAYMDFLGFRFGYDTGLFMDLAACPPTIDYAGPAGMAFYRTTTLRYTYESDFGLSMGVAFESPDLQAASFTGFKINRQQMPDVPAFVQYAWNNASHFRVGGIVRGLSYRNSDDKERSDVGWGIQGSTLIGVNDWLHFFGQYSYGRGIGAQLRDLGNLAVDLVADPKDSKKLMTLPMQAWYAGLQVNLTDNLFCSATYSQSVLESVHNYKTSYPSSYERGQYLVGNLFWNATTNLQLGVEYLHGWRKPFSGETDQANRLNVAAKFSF